MRRPTANFENTVHCSNIGEIVNVNSASIFNVQYYVRFSVETDENDTKT